MKLKLGQLVAEDREGRPRLLLGFRWLRSMALPARQAYWLALAAGVVDTQWVAYQSARLSAVKRFGKEQPPMDANGREVGWFIPAGDEIALKNFHAEMEPLLAQEMDLPIPEKIKLPEGCMISADELLPLVEAGIVEVSG